MSSSQGFIPPIFPHTIFNYRFSLINNEGGFLSSGTPWLRKGEKIEYEGS